MSMYGDYDSEDLFDDEMPAPDEFDDVHDALIDEYDPGDDEIYDDFYDAAGDIDYEYDGPDYWGEHDSYHDR